jgi:hypothetical protein
MRFEAIVTRAEQETPYKTAVHFRRRGRFLREAFETQSDIVARVGDESPSVN